MTADKIKYYLLLLLPTIHIRLFLHTYFTLYGVITVISIQIKYNVSLKTQQFYYILLHLLHLTDMLYFICIDKHIGMTTVKLLFPLIFMSAT